MDRATTEFDDSPAVNPAIERELQRWTRVCWAIDPARALLVAANATGLARLGLPVGAHSVPLDPAMPALSRLRRIASTIGPGEGRIETLEFATPAGSEILSCDVYRLSEAPGLLIVAPEDAHPARSELTDPEREQSSLRSDEAEAPRRLRNDAETLAEIARRIREGQSAWRDRPSQQSENAGPPPLSPAAERASDEARLAHELRTPLSAIVAASEIMKDQRFGPLGNERYVGYAADIHESARHALGVINAMLGARGPSSPGDASLLAPRLQFADIDVNAIAASAVSSLQPLAAGAGLTLHLAVAPRLPRVVADAVSVRQILLNLLTNALKFTPHGGRIEVATRYAPDGPVYLEVRDSGVGISPADMAHMRNGSAPVGGSGLPRTPGSLGIGLAVARSLAIANGATLTLDSTPGEGTLVGLAFGRDRVVPV